MCSSSWNAAKRRVLAAEFARFLDEHARPVRRIDEVVERVTGLEQRLGPVLFKELLALHFSPTRPHKDDWTDHPVIVLLVREIERARGDGEVHPEVDAFYSATFFLLGIYGVLTTTDEPGDPRRDAGQIGRLRRPGLEVR